MDEYVFETEEVDTAAGEYVIRWIADLDGSQPYDDGFALIKSGGRNQIDIDTAEPWAPPAYMTGDPIRVAQNVIGTHADWENHWDWERRSGAALVRYLTLKGFMGVTLVSDDYSPTEASADRRERVWGVAWDRGGSTDQAVCLRNVAIDLSQWHAWAEGDMFGYTVTSPDGGEIDSCWGYYGIDGEREHTRELALEAIAHDVEENIKAAETVAAELFKAANLVGAGFVGVI